MNKLEKSLIDLVAFLNEDTVPYMVIGGIANAFWGEPRATIDIDVTVWIEERGISQFIEKIGHRFTILPTDPVEFIEHSRVLPVKDEFGTNIDIIFGVLPYEHEAINRTVAIQIGGVEVNFISLEDLILHKIISERQKDHDDVRGLIKHRKNNINRIYLDSKIEELSVALGQPNTYTDYLKWLET